MIIKNTCCSENALFNCAMYYIDFSYCHIDKHCLASVSHTTVNLNIWEYTA